jgi:hypothetical protein
MYNPNPRLEYFGKRWELAWIRIDLVGKSRDDPFFLAFWELIEWDVVIYQENG